MANGSQNNPRPGPMVESVLALLGVDLGVDVRILGNGTEVAILDDSALAFYAVEIGEAVSAWLSDRVQNTERPFRYSVWCSVTGGRELDEDEAEGLRR